jgi:hypothetical protein
MADITRWQLELGDEVVAKIIDEHAYEFPWARGRLVDSPGFERFKDYFDSAEDGRWSEDLEVLSAEIEARGDFILRDLQTGTISSSVILYNFADNIVCFRSA